MVNTRRNLSILPVYVLLALLTLSSQPLLAAATDALTFRTLAVRRASPKLFYNDGEKEVRLHAGDTALSNAYTAPPSGKIEIYCYVPAKDHKLPPVKVTLAEAQLSNTSDNILLILTNSNSDEANKGAPSIETRMVDASLEAHPLNTARVFNFSKRDAAAKIEDEFAQINSGKDHLFKFPEDNKMWVKIAAYEGSDEGWIMRNGGPKAVFPNTRSIIVLSDAYPSREDPEGKRITLRNIVDRHPPVPAES